MKSSTKKRGGGKSLTDVKRLDIIDLLVSHKPPSNCAIGRDFGVASQ